jgi:2-amino-4-hydroxy-6-hydroxymethyldihydropteridine diphosphokinase
VNEKRVRAVIALGSNLGGRRAHLAAALEALRAEPDITVVAASDWIETRAVGGPPGQGPFLNGAVEVETTLDARALLERLQAIERGEGRERTAHHAPRTLDLDLILYGDEQIDEPDLIVPHPRCTERVFVLQPMAQIDPDRRIPGEDRTVRQCLRELWP